MATYLFMKYNNSFSVKEDPRLTVIEEKFSKSVNGEMVKSVGVTSLDKSEIPRFIKESIDTRRYLKSSLLNS